MKFTYTFGMEELERSKKIPDTAEMFAETQHAGVVACDKFASTYITPLVRSQQKPTDRERVLFTLYYRLVGYCRSVVALNHPIHFQSITSASRSMLELYLDMELIHQNKIPDGVAKAHAFTEAQKLRGALKIIRFFADNPTLDSTPSTIDPQREYVNQNETRISADVVTHWGTTNAGRPNFPEHWSHLNFKGRAAALGSSFELMVHEVYDLRNFQVHTGLAGVTGLEKDGYVRLCGISYGTVIECMRGAFRILGKELPLPKVLSGYDDFVEQLARIPGYALIDRKLTSAGEPSRFTVQW